MSQILDSRVICNIMFTIGKCPAKNYKNGKMKIQCEINSNTIFGMYTHIIPRSKICSVILRSDVNRGYWRSKIINRGY